MSELKQFRLPDVGEGLTEAEIVRWHVEPGDEVTVNQTIVEVETAKAVVELPCPFAGVVAGLLVPEGATADVGTPIIAVDVSRAARQRREPADRRAAATAARPAEDLVPEPPAEAGDRAGHARQPWRRSRSARRCWSATASSSAGRHAAAGSLPPARAGAGR